MGWSPFSPKRLPSGPGRGSNAESTLSVNARIDAALDQMERTSVEIGRRRAELRQKCPLDDHDRCHSH